MIWSNSSNSYILEEINKTYIALILKKEALEIAMDYRPISLYNATYKLITKIIDRRLKPFLNRLISSTLEAFVSGHQIIDNIIIAQEIPHSTKSMRGKNVRFTLK